MSITNDLCKELIKGTKYRFLDKNNISWRWVDSEWIGKRSVWTFDFRACWLEETTSENVKKWWCGKESDYNEIFKQQEQ
jgi:hypothetical protein